MKVPLELSFRNIPKTDDLEALVREKAAKLEKICDYISSCRVAIEKPLGRQITGNQYRVRLDITVPPGHELIVALDPGEYRKHEPLPALVRQAFKSAARQLRDLVKRQRLDVKHHPAQEAVAIVAKLHKDEGYGFLETVEGRQIYFHRNAVLNDDFERLTPGVGVNFTEEEGQDGPQATTVRLVDKPGARLDPSEESGSEPLVREINRR